MTECVPHTVSLTLLSSLPLSFKQLVREQATLAEIEANAANAFKDNSESKSLSQELMEANYPPPPSLHPSSFPPNFPPTFTPYDPQGSVNTREIREITMRMETNTSMGAVLWTDPQVTFPLNPLSTKTHIFPLFRF